MIITVDGPAGAGKGTLAQRLATRLGLAHLDTGKLYRALAHAMLAKHADLDDAAAAVTAAAALAPTLDADTLDDAALLTEEVGRAASRISVYPAVREALVDFQRGFARNPPGGAPGAVLDGRDTGTVICPDADVKFFLTARADERARRRHKELLARHEPSIYARVLADIEERDHRDASRSVAPLRAADDAIVIDTSAMTADEVFDTAIRHITARS